MFTTPGVGFGQGANMGTIYAEFGLDISRLRQGTNEARQEINALEQESMQAMNNVGGMLTGLGSTLTMGLTAPLAGFSLVTINAASQFEQAMSRVEAVSGATGRQFEDLTAIARDLGRETSFTATQAAEGLQYLAMAGWEVEDMVEGMEPILRMAEAAQVDLGRATDITSDIMTAFRIPAEEAGRVSDVLAASAMSANTDVEQLGDTMAYAAPSAQALGFDLEEVAAAAGKLADAGIKGSRAGTSLDAVFRDLSSITESASDELEEYNIEIFDSEDNMNDLAEIIEDYEEALHGVSDAEAARIKEIGLTSRALRGLNALIGTGGEELAEYTDELRESDGAVDEMGESIRDNLRYEMTRLRSILNSILIDFGGALVPMVRESVVPAVEWFAEAVSGVSESFAELDPRVQTVYVGIGLLAGAIGPLMTIVGKWLTLNKTLALSIATLITKIHAKKAALTGLLMAINPVKAAVVAIGAALGIATTQMALSRRETRDLAGEMETYLDRTEELDELADRYEELTEKTERSASEQEELRQVTEDLANLVPTAVEGWDDYNEVLGINIDQVRDLSEEQRRLAANVMETRIQEQEAALEEVERKYGDVEENLQNLNRLHNEISEELGEERDQAIDINEVLDVRDDLLQDMLTTIYESSDGWVDTLRNVTQITEGLVYGNLTIADMNDLLLGIANRWEESGAKVDEEREKLERMREQLEQIRGIEEDRADTEEPEEPETPPAPDPGPYEEFKRIMNEVTEEAKEQTAVQRALGEEYDLNEVRAEILRDTLAELLEEGEAHEELIRLLARRYNTWTEEAEDTEETFTDLVTQLRTVTGVMETVDQLTADEIRERRLLNQEYDETEIKIDELTRVMEIMIEEGETSEALLRTLSMRLAEFQEQIDATTIEGDIYRDTLIAMHNELQIAEATQDALGRSFDETAFRAEYLEDAIEDATEKVERAYQEGEISTDRYRELSGQIDELSRMYATYSRAAEETEESTFDLAAAEKELREELDLIEARYKTLGDEVDVNSESADELRRHINLLLREGFEPTSDAVQDAYEELQEYEDISYDIVEVEEELEKALSDASAEYSVHGDEIEYLQEQSSAYEEAVIDLIGILGEEGLAVAENRELVEGLRNDHEELEEQIERMVGLERVYEEKEEALERLETRTELWTEEMTEAEAESRALEEEIQILESAMHDLADILGIDSEEVQELREQIVDLRGELSEAEQEEALEQLLERQEEQLERTRLQYELLHPEMDETEREAARLEAEIGVMNESLVQMAILLGMDAEAVEDLKEEIEELRNELDGYAEEDKDFVEETLKAHDEALEELTIKQELWTDTMSDSEAETQAMEERLRIFKDTAEELAIELGADHEEVERLRIEIRRLAEELDEDEEVVRGFFEGLREELEETHEDLEDFWYDFGRTLHGEVAQMFRDILDDMQNWEDAVKSLFDRIADHMLDVLAELAVQWALAQFTPGFAADFMSYHQGGQVPGSPNEERLVMARGSEWYIPDELMDLVRAGARQYSTGEYLRRDNGNSNSSFDYQQLAQAVGNEVAKHVNNGNPNNPNGNGDNGDTPVNFNIYAMDSQDVSRVFMENGEALARAALSNAKSNGTMKKLLERID